MTSQHRVGSLVVSYNLKFVIRLELIDGFCELLSRGLNHAKALGSHTERSIDQEYKRPTGNTATPKDADRCRVADGSPRLN